MTPDYRTFLIVITTGFVVAIALAIVGLAEPGLLPGTGTNATTVRTASSANVAAPATAPALTAVVTSTAATLATPAGGALTVVAKDTAFDKTSLRAQAGSVTIELDNRDEGMTHNFHLFRGSDASGESVGMTSITSGPDKQTLAVALTAGAYFYHCDVHPSQMMGDLTVS